MTTVHTISRRPRTRGRRPGVSGALSVVDARPPGHADSGGTRSRPVHLLCVREQHAARLASALIVQLAATASMAALRAVARDRLCRTIDPAAIHKDSVAARKNGEEQVWHIASIVKARWKDGSTCWSRKNGSTRHVGERIRAKSLQ